MILEYHLVIKSQFVKNGRACSLISILGRSIPFADEIQDLLNLITFIRIYAKTHAIFGYHTLKGSSNSVRYSKIISDLLESTALKESIHMIFKDIIEDNRILLF